MILLGIDTSTNWVTVGLYAQDSKMQGVTWQSQRNHGRELMPAIITLLGEKELTPADITHLAVALGPGGFSSVRVGLSTAIGLATAKETPVTGISTHVIEAEQYIKQINIDSPGLYSLIPAGRNEISWAHFNFTTEIPLDTGVCTKDNLVKSLPEKVMVCGESAEFLCGRIDQNRILSPTPPTRKANQLLELAKKQFKDIGPIESQKLRPIYARKPNITSPNTPV